MLLDGSGSIQPADWTTMLEGVATAVEDPRCFSQDGSVELTVIQFAGFTSQLHFGISDTTLEAGPIVINQTNNHTVASAIRSISQKGGPTPTAMGIYLAADILSNDTNGYLQGTSWQGLGSRHFNPGNRQIIDVITDGAPTICMEKGRYDHIWNCYSDCLGYTCSQQSAESALAYLRNTLQMDDNDEFNVQAINTAPYYIDIPWLKNNLTFPQPGHYAPSFTPGGWVYNVSTYQELCVSIHKQFALLFHSITNTAVLQPSYAWFVDPNSRNNAARVDIAPMN